MLRAQHLDAGRLRPGHPVARDVDGAQLDVLGRVADLGPEHVQGVAPLEQGRVPHQGVEQQRPLLEPAQRVARPVELPRHRHRVGPAVALEHPHVGPPQPLRPRRERDGVRRGRHPRHLRGNPVEAVEVHHDAPVGVVDVHVGRRDVDRRRLEQRVVRHRRGPARPSRGLDALQLLGRYLGRLGQEVGVGDLQAAGGMHPPRAPQVVGVGEPDVASLVVGEVQVVGAQRVGDPVGNPDERGPLDVLADARVQLGSDDRRIGQPLHPHRLGLGARRRAERQDASRNDDQRDVRCVHADHFPTSRRVRGHAGNRTDAKLQPSHRVPMISGQQST